ncbi:pre-toxin TG domain-containing protein [Carnobacterium gallinarum]|uniref:pre-toxin TG domain-containing protein n=1 Tax=Carnobacterium gallinarum TaxID=2749 RepID=UPI0005504B5E|nr:pre-toxin TG domain-containing protein [Carnobacterium gallinarum]
MDDLGNTKSFDKKTGTYTYVDCSGKDWYKKISDYNDVSPTQRIEIVQTDDYGYGLKVYIDGHYSKQASDNLMYAQSQDYLKEMGRTAVTMTGELTGAYDVYRLFTGKDPLTGDKTSRLEAGLWTAILLLPQAKMVMAAKELKAGNKALKGLNLTEKELKLLNKSGYFEDVGKLEKASGAGKLKNPEIGNKLDYLFGKAKGNKHNIQRSQTMQSELSKIGIYDTPSSRELLNNHLKNVVNDSSNILKIESRSYIAKELPGTPTVNYTATVRESFLKGPNGGVKIESVWDGDRLLTIIVKGGK